MDRIGLLEDYDSKNARKALDLMLRDKQNEFRELAKALKIPTTTTEDWETIVLKYCLDFEDCLKIWTDNEEPDSIKNAKCMTIMREISKGKKNFTEIINLENIIQTLFTEFHHTYKQAS